MTVTDDGAQKTLIQKLSEMESHIESVLDRKVSHPAVLITVPTPQNQGIAKNHKSFIDKLFSLFMN
jgi:hypothetical protein